MALPFEVTVALRYIRSKRRGPVSLITMITVGGVAVGVCALTVVTSVWNGFEAEFLDKLLGINAHAVVLRNGDVFRDYDEISEKIRKQPGIAFVQPFVYSEVIAQSAKGVMGVAIKGIDPALAQQTALGKYIDESVFAELAKDRDHRSDPFAEESEDGHVPGIFIGKELRESLHAEVGEIITIISPYGGNSGTPRTKKFQIKSVFHSGMYEFDARMVFVELGEAQAYFRLFRTVTGLEVWGTDPMQSRVSVTTAVASIDPENPLGYEVRDWTRTNRGLFGAVRSQKALISLVLFAIIIVASFNIISTLILLILEKGREIAVLKALGCTNRSILTIFILDGQLIGLAGNAPSVAAQPELGAAQRLADDRADRATCRR